MTRHGVPDQLICQKYSKPLTCVRHVVYCLITLFLKQFWPLPNLIGQCQSCRVDRHIVCWIHCGRLIWFWLWTCLCKSLAGSTNLIICFKGSQLESVFYDWMRLKDEPMTDHCRTPYDQTQCNRYTAVNIWIFDCICFMFLTCFWYATQFLYIPLYCNIIA